MITIPETNCPPCELPIIQTIEILNPLDDVCPPCELPEPPGLVAQLPETLCYCPLPPDPEVPVITPEPLKRKTVVICYPDYIKSIVLTKFCETGPRCR
jgi:hypothetical protein